jgi:hypothetical protein
MVTLPFCRRRIPARAGAEWRGQHHLGARIAAAAVLALLQPEEPATVSQPVVAAQPRLARLPPGLDLALVVVSHRGPASRTDRDDQLHIAHESTHERSGK